MKKDFPKKAFAFLRKKLTARSAVKALFLLAGAFLLGTAAGAAEENLFGFSSSSSYTDPSLPVSTEGNWGLSFQDEGKTPVGNATFEELAQYNAYYADDTEEKVLYLTFDAGYENGNTGPILDALAKHGVSATFFVVGPYIESHPELIKRMAEEGHTVGNHTWHHPDMTQISTMESFKKELIDVENAYHNVTGQEMTKFYRPPQGKYNKENLKMAQQLGYKTFFWSLAYVDWNQDNQPSPEKALDKLLSRTHPGAIVLLHSTSSTNARILDDLLTKWMEMGYEVKALTELAGQEEIQ